MQLELSLTERIMLINQMKILSLLEPDETGSYNTVIRAMEAGYIDEYSDILTRGLTSISTAEQTFVSDVLKMFLDLAEALEDGKVDQKHVAALPKYLGFCGNHESKLQSYADYLLLPESHYRALKPVPENSYLPVRADYETYLQIWSEVHTKPEVLPKNIDLFMERLKAQRSEGESA